MKLGKFIVIDGTDGSGKGTQTTILAQKLALGGFAVETADFPRYGQESAIMVESYLAGALGTAQEVGPYAASNLYAVDRWAASREMKNQLACGKVIISNRWVSSNAGHQAGKISDPAKREEFLNWLFDLEYKKLELPQPDLNILLYVPPEVGQELKSRQKDQNGQVMDIHEADISHLKSASQAYLEVAKKMGWTIIDCAPEGQMKSIEEISELIWQEVLPIIQQGDKKMSITPVSQKVEVLGHTQGQAHPEFPELIERAGRTCYQSWEKAAPGTAEKFVDMVIRSGHESVIEHSWFVFLIKNINDGITTTAKGIVFDLLLTNNLFSVSCRANGDYLVSGNARMWRNYFKKANENTVFKNIFLAQIKQVTPILFKDFEMPPDNFINDRQIIINPEINWTTEEKLNHWWTIIRFSGYTRAFTHQLVRHRPVAISQESQRYCDEAGFYSNGYFVIPPSIVEAGKTEEYLTMLKQIDDNYKALQTLTNAEGKRLIRNEDARFLLPNACCSEIVMSANLKEWHWILKMRCDKHAQWEIRQAAMSALRQFQNLFPGCFDDFVIADDGLSAELK